MIQSRLEPLNHRLTAAQLRRRRVRIAERRLESAERELRATSEAAAAWRWFKHVMTAPRRFWNEPFAALLQGARFARYQERRHMARERLRELRRMQRQQSKVA